MHGENLNLLCTGDVHLGRHPTRIPSEIDGQQFSPKSVWQSTVNEAIRRRVDAVVITGDVVDRENRYFEAYGAFEAGISRLEAEEIPVVAGVVVCNVPQFRCTPPVQVEHPLHLGIVTDFRSIGAVDVHS